MKLFQLQCKYFAVMGIVPPQPPGVNQPKIVSVKRLLYFMPLITQTILLSVFLGYEVETLDEFADSFNAFLSAFFFSIIFAILLWKMDNLFKLFEDLEESIDQRIDSPESKQTYEKLNEKVEKWTRKFQFSLVKVTVPALLMPQMIISFYLYFSTDLGSEAFSLAYPIWAPFDWRTPIGYLILFTIECATSSYVCHFCACFIGTYIASCDIMFNFCKEIKSEIRIMNENSEAKTNPVELRKRVPDIVRFHAKAKQLVSNMNNIFAFIFIIYFVWSLSTICSALLVVQLKLEQDFIPLDLVKPMFSVFWSFAIIFLICEFGERLTVNFDQLTNAFYDCDWTAFPKDIQRILPIIIQNTQREVVIETFEKASCSRETFKKVVNRAFSFFMVFRKFR